MRSTPNEPQRQRLLETLQRYGASGAEAATRERFLRFVADEPRSADRDLAFGHLTASALVVNLPGTHALLIYHRKLERWLQPGGHADGSFDLLAAATREVLEETGVPTVPASTEPLDLDIHLIPPRGEVAAHWHYDVRYLLRATDDTITMQEEEVADARWFGAAELPTLQTDDSVRRLVAKFFAQER